MKFLMFFLSRRCNSSLQCENIRHQCRSTKRGEEGGGEEGGGEERREGEEREGRGER